LFFASIEAFQSGAELAAKNAVKNFDRQKERIAGAYPAGVVRRDPARWNNAVNVRMQQEVFPHACRMLIAPISAPRCRGSAATSSKVCALAVKSGL
jgi:hypothetical protein